MLSFGEDCSLLVGLMSACVVCLFVSVMDIFYTAMNNFHLCLKILGWN